MTKILNMITALQILLIVSYVYSFPDGAPLNTCGSMMPGHHAMPIETAAPFKILVSPNPERSLNGDNLFYIYL